LRSVVFHFTGVPREAIAQSLLEFGAREQVNGSWVYPASGDPLLYINWFADSDALSVPEWRNIEETLGAGPDVSLIADVSGRASGTADVFALARRLLTAHRGVAQDDHSNYLWKIAELEKNTLINGRRFFFGP
jgi:hypothetical protein